jgi:hypothetical protein
MHELADQSRNLDKVAPTCGSTFRVSQSTPPKRAMLNYVSEAGMYAGYTNDELDVVGGAVIKVIVSKRRRSDHCPAYRW